MDYTKEEQSFIVEAFKTYEEKFGEWLYTAWDFSAVDWLGLAKEAELCVQIGTPISDERRQEYFPPMEDNALY